MIHHPVDSNHKISKHGAPGDKPSVQPPALGLLSTSVSAHYSVPAMTTSTVMGGSTSSSVARQPVSFAVSNQVEAMSKLYKRNLPSMYSSSIAKSAFNSVPSSSAVSSVARTAAVPNSCGTVGPSSVAGANDPMLSLQPLFRSGHFQGTAHVETVTDVLIGSGLAKYIDLFREQEVTSIYFFTFRLKSHFGKLSRSLICLRFSP